MKRPGQSPVFLLSFVLLNRLPAWFSALTAPSGEATATTPAEIALGPRTSFIYVNRPTVQLNTVELFDSRRRSVFVHLDEGKAARPARVSISHYCSRLNRTCL
jgi:hypothetical protein